MYICKIACLEEMNKKWDYEIEQNIAHKENWIIWKEKFLKNFQKDIIIPYYGILDGTIICEATAMLSPEIVQNSEGLVGGNVVYLSAFRTIEAYRSKGYFSKLMHFMLGDLKQKGFAKATLGVEPCEETNKKIYAHFGFSEYIKSATESYPDGTVIQVDYYGLRLANF